MPAPINLAGRAFGRLTAIRLVTPDSGRRRWECDCSCGRSATVAGAELRRGDTISCGCYRQEATAERGKMNLVHGFARTGLETLEYRAWVEMRRRCSNPNFIGYEYYGGRGITVCERWDIFQNFLDDMGPKPTDQHSLDRYPNTDGNYEPSNCRWATAKEQANNRRPRP